MPADLQTADYDDLCGCVAVVLSKAETDSADLADDFRPGGGQRIVERLLRQKGRERLAAANCPTCLGSGLVA